MTASPKWGAYLLVSVTLTLVSAIYAGFIDVTAELLHISGVAFWPMFGVFALLYVPGGVKRMAEAVAAGPELRSRLMALRQEYIEAVTIHPELRAWPDKTMACIQAASAILVRACVRAWTVMIVAIVLFRVIGTEVDNDLRPVWIMLTLLQVYSLGSRAYRRGTLPLAGMGSGEMEAYCRNRLALIDDRGF